MHNTQHHDDFPPPTIDQIRDLAAAVREDFGGDLSRAVFTEKLRLLLEDVPGFETGEEDARLIESAWVIYIGRASEF
ncbi:MULTISPECIES: hypothetical protein [Burkholderia]|uniref:hypothetical protein n=1 Tax=Burkholderia TaxID=32008 RepID=UPI0008A1EECF|nr:MULTISPECIES: hypothetical protein [Burkholderia]MBJ9683937.1 hypothetical protein [Burkholderia multivorans]MCO7333058.1 hypothetical protein [Burkholderia multivorans]MCO7339561.1 hypothetical protein [Burkholderia multivorans]MCO7345539.1 hypothetical protein [Burkholderia multivorans]OFT91357.1 hypothetical protein HMPREF3115_12080 [Burkholderia sp. HMSC10F09]